MQTIEPTTEIAVWFLKINFKMCININNNWKIIKLKIQHTMISWDEENVNYGDLNAYLCKRAQCCLHGLLFYTKKNDSQKVQSTQV